jgi:hypothetical protein
MKIMKNKKSLLLLFFVLVWVGAFAQLSMKKTDEGILITDGDKDVLLYHTANNNSGGKCERCNYIHPLYGIDGSVLTEDAPSDHPHQRGIFWAWRQVFVDGRQVADQWELQNFEQEIIEFEFMKQRSGNVILKTEVDWLSDHWKINGEEIPFIKEYGRMEIWPANGKVRRIDFEIHLRALEDGVKLGGSDDDKGYGGFSLRMKLPDDVSFSGPKGKVIPMDTEVVSPGYINISGSVSNRGKSGGIVILDHPDNPGYPQSWILRDKNSMQNAVWPGREPVDISVAEPLVLKYTLLVYSGKMNDKKIQRFISDRSVN